MSKINLKNITEIMKRDFKASFSNPIVTIVLVAIIILPSLYALLNIQACWNPYENTNEVEFAIANLDNGSTIDGTKINVGNEIVKDNPENLWINYGKYSDLTESQFFRKFKKEKIVFAIKLDQTTLFDYPINLFDFEIESDFEIIEERDFKLNFLLNFE